MKTALSLGLALLALAPAEAQVFRPHAANRGPVVSLGIGYSAHGDHGAYRHAHHRPGYAGRSYYGGYYRGAYGYVPVYGYYDGYGAGYPCYGSYDDGPYGGSAAGAGLLLGALAGGIIGHNSGDFHHNGWRGAAWGAGAGWFLGTLADANRRAVAYPQPVVVSPAPVVATQPVAAQPPAQPVTIINNYYHASPMSAANGLFGR